MPIGMDLTLNKAPAQIGQSLQVKSIDETAKIVMEDYGMTDLRTDVRESESMTPKLPPPMQAQADNFFSPKPRSRRDAKMPFNAGALAAAALSGRLADPVSTQRSIGDVHARRVRPPVHTVADDRFLKH